MSLSNFKNKISKPICGAFIGLVSLISAAQVQQPREPLEKSQASGGENTVRRLEQLQRELAIRELEVKIKQAESPTQKSVLPPLPVGVGPAGASGRYAIPSTVLSPPMTGPNDYAVVAISAFKGIVSAEIVRGDEHYSVRTGDKLSSVWTVKNVGMDGVVVTTGEGKKKVTKTLPSDLLHTKPAILHIIKEDKNAPAKTSNQGPRLNDIRLGDIVSAVGQKQDGASIKPEPKSILGGYGSSPGHSQ